jgi:hypothetical protein
VDLAVSEVHQVQARIRMVFYGIQEGPDPVPVSYPEWSH